MRQIQASEATTHLLRLLDDVERGETVIITRRGRAIARIAPDAGHRRAVVKKAMAEIAAIRQRTGRISVAELLSARDEGRK